ncbi:unnamed protein product [Linum trigynum]|uniref:Uncharacterized protein n=1 Tax=Linum trigynum TaxID=586398 RepID=A0AAV2EW82_9ROSI
MGFGHHSDSAPTTWGSPLVAPALIWESRESAFRVDSLLANADLDNLLAQLLLCRLLGCASSNLVDLGQIPTPRRKYLAITRIRLISNRGKRISDPSSATIMDNNLFLTLFDSFVTEGEYCSERRNNCWLLRNRSLSISTMVHVSRLVGEKDQY